MQSINPTVTALQLTSQPNRSVYVTVYWRMRWKSTLYKETCTIGITLTNTWTNMAYYNENELILWLNECYNMNFQLETCVRYVTIQ